MNMRGYFLGGLFALFIVLISGTPAKAQSTSARLSIINLEAFPGVINDTSQYSFDIPVINEDPIFAINVPVSLFMSVDGGPALPLLSNYSLPSPTLPGDTVLLPVQSYLFDATRFTGGGITHDIIVWPMAYGVISNDSAAKSVIFNHTMANLSHKLAVAEPMPVPGIIIEGTSYSFDLTVVNQDPSRDFIHPVTLMLSVDGDAPTQLVENFSPGLAVAPGDSFTIPVSNYVFDAARFGGGSVTHDIIVWPMAFAVLEPDTAVALASFVWELSVGAANESETAGTGNDYGFVAEPVPSGIALSWETGYEKPGVIFEIEKADLPAQLFSGLFDIPGTGNYEMGSYYTVLDEAPHNGTNHYQLIAYTPTGGKFTLASATATWTQTTDHQNVDQPFVHNNPFDQNLTFTVPMGQRGPVRLFIFDQTGRKIWTGQFDGIRGENTINADLSGKSSGVYFYMLEYGGKEVKGKILKR
ncbi:MAG: T9SS type A sorting domain-containing protein [Bacteroidia bacterium]